MVSRYKSVITNGGLRGYLRGLAKSRYLRSFAPLGRRGRLPLRKLGGEGVCPTQFGADASGVKSYDQRLKTMAPLVPPKPKELESA
jgi:hypothetical protein